MSTLYKQNKDQSLYKNERLFLTLTSHSFLPAFCHIGLQYHVLLSFYVVNLKIFNYYKYRGKKRISKMVYYLPVNLIINHQLFHFVSSFIW